MRCFQFLLVLGLLASLSGCDNGKSKAARDNGSGGQQSNNPNSPKPSPAKIVEGTRDLIFQRPTQDESEFMNIMNLGVSEGERAYFSFKYAPDEDGTFYFTLEQVRLYPKDCKNTGDHKYTMEIYWQRVQGNQRVVLKKFSPNIDDFDYQRGNKYILTYALMDLKQFADCQSVTLKFATFQKNYKTQK
ncbi:MAG: hypothetical protein JSU04_18940 [Bdellovibrionales bacterium]|nr:hypothetical protein [Bdellovibrionales bacterium]